MKCRMFWTLVLCSFFVSVGRAQTETDSGTPGTVPIFTGSSKIGNSAVSQLGGTTSIGATIERLGTKFQVLTDSAISPQPGQGPTAIFGAASASLDLTVGVFGWATASSGNTLGV